MTLLKLRYLLLMGLLALTITTSGCRNCMFKRSDCCDIGQSCTTCGDQSCGTCGDCCETDCCPMKCGKWFAKDPCKPCIFKRPSLAIPETYPLGSVVRAHYHTQQANGEAADFILHRHEFVGSTAELTPYGRDHIVEIAARMRSAPFPVIVERSEHNADPELDQHRRDIVAQVLTDFGNPDAQQRTFVSQSYGRHLNSREAQSDYFQFIFSRGFGGAGGFGNLGGTNTNFGGGGGGFGFGGF